MPTQKIPILLGLMCISLSICTSLATYYITYTDPRAPIGGPTKIYHGLPLHWMVETWPMPRQMPGPVLPTISTEPINFLIDTLLYTTLFTITVFLVLHATNRRQRNRLKY